MRAALVVGSIASLLVGVGFVGSGIGSSVGCTLVLDGGDADSTETDAGADGPLADADTGPELDVEASADGEGAVEDALPSDAGLGFSPTNIASALGGIDASLLEDVDIAASNVTIGSDSNMSAALASHKGGVVYATVTQAGSVRVGVYIARSWRIEPNASLKVTGGFSIAFVALSTIDVLGRIDVSAQGTAPGPGGFAETGVNMAGTGPGGGAAGDSVSGKAGGGAGYCGTGGTGGSSSTPSPGGASYGVGVNVPLAGGSAGGGGDLGLGGGGGGAIELVAAQTVVVEQGAAISANGGGGPAGGSVVLGDIQGAAGGGAGGAILIEAPQVTIAGTLTANGGGGGGAGAGTASAGQNGQLGTTAAQGGNGGPGARGGSGGAGSAVDGLPGGAGQAANADSGLMAQPPGGGGGGAGSIRINTTGGAASISTGTISPSPTSTCVSQGALSH